ncbi:Eco57I restriction-modification methylase domain-containing protein [Fusobacterium ulcerans]|uniref:Eco57I restriction-modification methylase domain-containing protein n=1 Tax=Fusobacterium ulcerans TaxID=861 RepID=UPI00164E2182|nr:TaqI-like C-terminal specificity domain-containing protein [Fusobacterium ulcerans]
MELDRNKANIIDKLLENKFNVDNLKEFCTRILNVPVKDRKPYVTIYKVFKDYIENYQEIAEYVDNDKNKIYILAVKIKEEKDPVKARIKQREFIANILRERKKRGALVAFYNENYDYWRISVIKLDYEFTAKGIKEDLTPAKRLSYVVGEGEACKTAKDQFYTLFSLKEDSVTLNQLEEIFALEKVTNDFFKEYKNKYLDIKELLIKDQFFMEEAKKHDIEKPESFAEGFAKKLMGQLAFLYFLQKKGWLGVKIVPETLSQQEFNRVYNRALNIEKDILEKVYNKVNSDLYKLKKDELNAILSKEEIDLLASPFRNTEYFSEWGTGDKKFIRNLFEFHKSNDIDNSKTFFDDYLEVLFYNNLSKERGEIQYSLDFNCRIPFLNGGLFDPYGDYDWQTTSFNLSNDIFSNEEKTGILDIFDIYNFTINENDSYETEVAVDPEMLGKVFENLLEVSDRKSKGAFYTPREIVRYMTNESIMNYLLTNLEGKEIFKEDLDYLFNFGEFTKEYDQQIFEKDYIKDGKSLTRDIFGMPRNIITNSIMIDDLLAKVKIADPACGSGAFPLGILNEIVRARNILTFYINMIEILKEKDEQNYWRRIDRKQRMRKLYNLKLYTIQNCLHGVDIEPSAIDITKLRLWLSILVDSDNDNVKPLPNLDFNFMIGNSLIDEFEGMKLFDESLLTIDDFSTEEGTLEQKTLIKQHKLVQDRLFKTSEERKQDILKDIFNKQAEYFNEKNIIRKKDLKVEIESLENTLIEITLKANGNEKKLEEIKKGRKERRKPYFLWKLEFAKVFKENGGFDIVIGNPPYGAEINIKDLKVLKKKFKYNENNNSVCIFMDFAMAYWLKPKGTVSMIVPKSLLYSEKWFKLVENLLDYTPLLVDVEKAFEKVKLEQVFYVSNFSKKIDKYYARKFLNNEFINSNYIDTKLVTKFKSWICDIKQEELAILSKILNNVEIEYMKNIVDVKRGIGVQKLLKDKGSIEVIGGKQCQRYLQDGIKGFLNEEDIDGNKTKLEFMLQPKIIAQDLVAHIQNPVPHIKLSSFYDEKGEIIGLDTIQNIIVTSDKYNPRFILALLNSNFINWYTYKFIYSSAIRTMHFDKNYIGKIIVPKVSMEIQDKISHKVKIIEKFKIENKNIYELENEINKLIYNLYLLDNIDENIINNQYKMVVWND